MIPAKTYKTPTCFLPTGYCLLWVFLFVVATVPADAQKYVLWGTLKPVPYEVGFRSSTQFDTTRVLANGQGPRPVQVSMWYPARPHNEPRLRYRDYFLISASERTSEPLSEGNADEAVQEYYKLLGENGVERAAVDRWFAAECAASWNVPPADGAFPVVLVAQGMFHSAHHQAVLSEIIASHGFVVLTTPSPARISGPMTSQDDVVPHAEAQEQDLLFALKSIEGNRQADTRMIGLVGHSFGARSAFLLAVRDGRVKGLVSLDGGIANKFGKEWIQNVSGFQPENVRVPILHFFQDGESFVVPDFELLESLKGAPRFLVHLPGMWHMHFSSIGPVSAFIPGFSPTADRRLAKQWKAIGQYTVDFLSATLRGDQKAWERLERPGTYDKSILTLRQLHK